MATIRIWSLAFSFSAMWTASQEKTKPSPIRRPKSRQAWLVWGLIQAFPLIQRHNPNLRSSFAWQLGQELQKMPVRVVEVDGSRWHPTKNAGYVGDLPEKVAHLDPSLLGGSHRAPEIGEVDLEGEMLGDHLILGVRSRGPGWFLPQTQGGPALPAYPVESHASLLLLHSKLETKDLLVELHGKLEIRHRKVRLKESCNESSR